MHGHGWVLKITATADNLDHIGRVIDFSVLKQKFGTYIEENWDHGFLWNKNDPMMQDIFATHPEQKNFACDFNPTSEELARYLLFKVAPELMRDTGVRIVAITLNETENCSAEATI